MWESEEWTWRKRKMPPRATDLPKENECILEENGDTRVHDSLSCKTRTPGCRLSWDSMCCFSHLCKFSSWLLFNLTQFSKHTSELLNTVKWLVSVTPQTDSSDKLANRPYQALRIRQTESTWRQWENRKPAWSQWRATLVRLHTEIRKGGLLGDSTLCFLMGLCFTACMLQKGVRLK